MKRPAKAALAAGMAASASVARERLITNRGTAEHTLECIAPPTFGATASINAIKAGDMASP